MSDVSSQGQSIRLESRGKGVAVATRIVAWITMAGTVIAAGYTVASHFFSDSVPVNLPVTTFWPALPAGTNIDGPTAQVTGGGFSNAEVQVAGLDVIARSWLAASALLQGATVIAIAVVALMISSTVLKNDPFQPAIVRGIRTLGFTIIGGGIGWQICSGIGETLASTQVLQSTGGEFQNAVEWEYFTSIFGFPQPGLRFEVDLWPIWMGLAMLVLAAVFRHGARLQRDTAGLV